MRFRILPELLILLLVSSALACGGSAPATKAPKPKPKPVEYTPPEEPEEEPEPEPEPPPEPDPYEEFRSLLLGLSEEVAALRAMPFKQWGEASDAIAAYDGELAAFAERVPDEQGRIERLRDNIGKLVKAVAKKKKKQAEKALTAIEADLPGQP